MLQTQCPNPACGSPSVAVTRVSMVANPGTGALSGLIARMGFGGEENIGQAMRGAVALMGFTILFWFMASALSASTPWQIALWALTIFAVVTFGLMLVNYLYLRHYPPQARMNLTRHACKECRYTWMRSNSPPDTQLARLEWELEKCRKSGKRDCVSAMLSDIGAIRAIYKGEFKEARLLLEESLQHRRETGDKKAGYTLNNQSFVLHYLGELEQAEELAREAVAVMRREQEWSGLSASLHTLGATLLERGDVEGARAAFKESLGLKRKMANLELIAWDLEGFAAVARGEGDFYGAAMLLGAAGALRRSQSMPLLQAGRAKCERLLAEARACLGDVASAQAWNRGATMPLDQLIDMVTGQSTYPSPENPFPSVFQVSAR